MTDLYDPNKKVYPADEGPFSIVDLLARAVDPEYLHDNIPRISDYHLKIGEPVRFRLDHDLQVVQGGARLTPALIEGLVFPLLRPEHIASLRENPLNDIDASWELPGEKHYFRLNVFHDRDGMAAVIRLLPPSIPQVEEVGFPNEMTWTNIVNARQGLVLVTGVTGSGKSTTIASLLNRINRTRAVRIVTLEDPIEFVFTNQRALFSQREIGRHAASFASGLRSVLRENPDIIYVGEVRDQETATEALTAAETGHLVLTTMHTRDAMGALTRLVDMFPPERFREISVQLSFSLTYVLAQKLVPRAEGYGRCVAMEVLRNNTAIANLIRLGNWAQLYGAMETRVKDGMCTLEQALLGMYEQGLISKADAISHANDGAIVDRIEHAKSTARRL